MRRRSLVRRAVSSWSLGGHSTGIGNQDVTTGRKRIISTCKSCHGGCGVIATVENGRLVHLEGNPESPTVGTMCAKGLASIQDVYNPNRILHPLKRRGERGRGEWVWIETPRGRIRQVAQLFVGLDPRVVVAQASWWYPEEPGPEHGLLNSYVNVLTANDPPYDPAMGSTSFRSLPCRVYKVEDD